MTAPPRPGLSRRWIAFYGAVAVLAVLVAVFASVNQTPSVQEGVYLQVPEALAPGEPSAGDLVTACAPEGEATRLAIARGYYAASDDCPSGALPILKRVVATAGQTVRVTPAGVWVDGRPAPPAHAGPPPVADSGGRPIEPAYGTWTLGPGEVWLGSDIPNGYDSRYLGPLGADLLRSRARLAIPFDRPARPEV